LSKSKDELYIIGVDFKNNRDKYKKILNSKNPSWNDLNESQGFQFKSGEHYRQFIKKRQDRDGTLKKLNIVKEIINNIIKDKVEDKKDIESTPLPNYKESVEIKQDNSQISDKNLKEINLKKERVKLQDLRTSINKDIRVLARYEENQKILTNSIQNIKPYVNKSYKHITQSDNDLLIGLNDMHFGIMIDNYWNKYSPEIAKERLEHYIQEIISIKRTHNSENCYVCANGDIISGNTHLGIQLANRENVVEQVMGASELISWFLSELSGYFNNVYFSVVSGNHSRLSTKFDSPKGERLDDLIPFYIKARLQNITNVYVVDNIIDNTMSLINIRGLYYLGVHGDYDGINSSLKLIEMIPHKIYGVFSGHLHHNSYTYVQGYKLMMSGSLMGMDDYTIEKRILGSPQQLVCVCNNKGVKTMYDIIFK